MLIASTSLIENEGGFLIPSARGNNIIVRRSTIGSNANEDDKEKDEKVVSQVGRGPLVSRQLPWRRNVSSVVPITNLAWGRRQSSSNATHDSLPSAIANSSIQIFRAHCCTTRLRYCEIHSAYSANLDLTLRHKVQHDSNRLEDNRVPKTCTNSEGVSLSSVLT